MSAKSIEKYQRFRQKTKPFQVQPLDNIYLKRLKIKFFEDYMSIKTNISDIERSIKACKNVATALNSLQRAILEHTALSRTEGNQIKEIQGLLFAAGGEIGKSTNNINQLADRLTTLKKLAEKI